MHSLASHRESSKRRECRFARGTKAVLPRAVRPLAASARPQRFVAGSGLGAEPSLGIEEEDCLLGHSLVGEPKNRMLGGVEVSLGQVTAWSESKQALRSGVMPKTGGRAASGFAHSGSFGLLAGGATQRKMRAGCGVRAAMPNPSIERDVQGLSPLAAPHVKR